MYVMRQASRQSWRIGQTRPVKVVFMAYRNTFQAGALKLVAKKLQSSLVVVGELPEDGLTAYGANGDDLRMALARKIVRGDEEDAGTEEVFTLAGAPRPSRKSTWWTTAGSWWRSSRRPPLTVSDFLVLLSSAPGGCHTPPSRSTRLSSDAPRPRTPGAMPSASAVGKSNGWRLHRLLMPPIRDPDRRTPELWPADSPPQRLPHPPSTREPVHGRG